MQTGYFVVVLYQTEDRYHSCYLANNMSGVISGCLPRWASSTDFL